MFDIDELITECRRATVDSEPHRAVKEVLQRALANPSEVAHALRPTEGGIDVLHESSEFTIIHAVWAPGMRIYPHDHRTWAAIGVYTGQEDNTFYRRTAPGSGTLTSSGGKMLATGDVMLLGDDTIHDVANPLDRLTGAIHVYGGDFVNQARSQWGPGPLEEHPYNLDEARRQFEEANQAWRNAQAS
jgi:predicted metal-dependent enzyme (double-stranded beta helix superfamily)